MQHVVVSPLLETLLVVLLVASILQVIRITGWRGRLTLLTFVLLCAVTNPGRARHLRAIQRAVPGADVRVLNGIVEHHNFVVLSMVSIRGRLVSLGGVDRLLVGSLSCAHLSTISNVSISPVSRGMCAP